MEQAARLIDRGRVDSFPTWPRVGGALWRAGSLFALYIILLRVCARQYLVRLRPSSLTHNAHPIRRFYIFCVLHQKS